MLYGNGKRNIDRTISYQREKMKIKNVLAKPYIFWVAGIFSGYMFLNIILTKFYITIQYIPYFLDTILWGNFILSVLFSLSIGILISINTVLTYFNYKEAVERKKNIQTAAVTGAGTIGGLATGICSACVASVFPFFFSIFGITISFASLPFQGLEIQTLVIAILGINLYYIQRT